MKRIPLLLVGVAGTLALMAGSAFAGVARTAAAPANTSLPTISGTAQSGHTLTASNGSWSGTGPISYTYQWQRCNSSGSSCGSIGSATNQNYVASSGDVARTIRVAVTATNTEGKDQALSAATGEVASAGSAPALTRQANPSGTAQEGKTVTVDNGSWSGVQPITFSYQWQSCTTVSSVCSNLAGMTSSSLVVGASQVGTLLRATITASNSIGKTSAYSNQTAVVIAKATAPVNVSKPAISGSATVGQRLSASTGTWTGVTAAYRYQWSRCNANGTSCSGVYGATGASYGLGQADLGLAVRVSVTATNTIGSTTAISDSSAIKARVLQVHTFRSVLRAGQEVSAPNGPMGRAVGHFTAKATGNTVRWTLTFSHLTGRPTIARLNKGIRGTNGAAFKSLCRSCRSPNHGTLTVTASQLAAMLRGASYVNIHTSKNTRGEIRGQISRVS
jgi:hypothetical protein